MSQPPSPRPYPASFLLALPEPLPDDHPRAWTSARQLVFLRALIASGCVRTSARIAGMSRQSAYRLRARTRGGAFDRGWALAMARPAWPGAGGLSAGRVTQGDTVPLDSVNRVNRGVTLPGGVAL